MPRVRAASARACAWLPVGVGKGYFVGIGCLSGGGGGTGCAGEKGGRGN